MNDAVVLRLILMVVFGGICALIAQSKGRSAIGWFFIGFFFTLLGFVIVLIVSNLKVQDRRFQRLEQENNRLRERVRRDRIIANKRMDQVDHRLRAHDRVLNVDTSQVPQEEHLLEYEDSEEDDQTRQPTGRRVRPQPDAQG